VSQSLSRAVEGVGIALDSLRASKVRAALTILGVAIGVMVVIAMASAITGINRSVTAMLESAGPRTFYVNRFFQGGLNISDGSDELSPWRKNPWLTVADAEMVRQLPDVQDVSVSENTSGPVKYADVDLAGIDIAGLGPSWVYVTGGNIVEGRNFTVMEYAAGA
jgi:putative ABC transport system permease protein